MNKIRIAILDDHQIVIDGLKLLLSKEAQFDIVMEHTNGMNLLQDLNNIVIDVLLTDMMMPSMNGYEVSIIVCKKFPDVKIIALSMNGEGALVHKMIEEADIKGYLLKTSNKQVLVNAIDKVAQGGISFPDEILHELENFKVLKKEQEEFHLTARELEIVKYIANDFSNKQIAQALFISERTVETHRKNIFRKTETHSAIGLVELVRKYNLI
jgi:two-component system, NarL family, nitrate/nitrite response regulator NarL